MVLSPLPTEKRSDYVQNQEMPKLQIQAVKFILKQYIFIEFKGLVVANEIYVKADLPT